MMFPNLEPYVDIELVCFRSYSSHDIYHCSSLSQVQPYTGTDNITIGNGTQIPITHVGSGSISTTSHSVLKSGIYCLFEDYPMVIIVILR